MAKETRPEHGKDVARTRQGRGHSRPTRQAMPSPLPCPCQVFAMPLPCHCHDDGMLQRCVAIPLPGLCHVLAMLLGFRVIHPSPNPSPLRSLSLGVPLSTSVPPPLSLSSRLSFVSLSLLHSSFPPARPHPFLIPPCLPSLHPSSPPSLTPPPSP
jgi:hypothetical protein